MQQARDLRAEEAVEVVRNHEDGTGFPEMVSLEPKQAATPVGVDARQGRWRGTGCPSRIAAKAGIRGQHRRIPREEVERKSDPGSR
jgi:hypothetical protein